MPNRYDTDYEIGQDNIRTWGMDFHNPVFITSSDSGSLVIDSITAGGKLDAPVPQRVFWASMEGLIAGALLFGGGADALGALQAAAISVGLPFTLVLLAMCVALYLGLKHELRYVLGGDA
jgi:BCCT family betaine/carnitine transporter